MARTKRSPISTVGGHDIKVMREEFNALVNEMDDLRTQYAAALTKLDTQATQINALRADVTEIRTKFLVLTAKLDLDAGITDTNYAATSNPVALTSVAVATDFATAVDVTATEAKTLGVK